MANKILITQDKMDNFLTTSGGTLNGNLYFKYDNKYAIGNKTERIKSLYTNELSVSTILNDIEINGSINKIQDVNIQNNLNVNGVSNFRGNVNINGNIVSNGLKINNGLLELNPSDNGADVGIKINRSNNVPYYIKLENNKLKFGTANELYTFVSEENVYTDLNQTITDYLNEHPVTIGVVTNFSNGLMSASDKVKIDTMEFNAQENRIETIKVNSNTVLINNKIVNIDLSDYALKGTTLSDYGITNGVKNDGDVIYGDIKPNDNHSLNFGDNEHYFNSMFTDKLYVHDELALSKTEDSLLLTSNDDLSLSAQTITINGSTTIKNNAHFKGDLVIDGDLIVAGNISITGTLTYKNDSNTILDAVRIIDLE